MCPAHTKVAVIGGDPVVGEALEALLQAAGYRTLFLPESTMPELGRLLADCQLLVVAPVLSAQSRTVLLEAMLSPTRPVTIPVLELLPANGGQRLQGGHSVLWPCTGQELKRAIDALLLDRDRADLA